MKHYMIYSGSWSSIPLYCGTIYRFSFSPSYKDSSFGFRIIKTPKQ